MNRNRSMLSRRSPACFLCTLLALFFWVPGTSAGTLTGTVRNVTTGLPGAGLEVVLLELQSGMAPVGNTRTDSQGRFSVENEIVGRAPVLVRVQYKGVNYHANVAPGNTTAEVEIFEPTQDRSVLDVATRVMVFQPRGAELLVGEEFSVHNHSRPPATFARDQGTFEFALPEGAELVEVSAWGPAGLPTVQGTINQGNNRYAIGFPLRPNENGVRLSYQMPYAGETAAIQTVSSYLAKRMLLLIRPSMKLEAPGFLPAGTEQGWNVYARDNVAAGERISLTVSGTAPPPGDEPEQGTGVGAGATIVRVPGRLDDVKWILIAGFAALFALGAVFLWRSRSSGTAAIISATPAGGFAGETTTAESSAGSSTGDLDRQVRARLDEIKDSLLRLEIRRQAGTIPDAEYAQERERIEKLLRDFLQG